MTESYTVLVTGSRDWLDAIRVFEELNRVAEKVGMGRMVVMHGYCGSGADKYADLWACSWDVGLKRRPADWRPGGAFNRSAGFERNAAMVAEGADLCMAFLMPCSQPRCRRPAPHPSHGASHCADLAEKAGIRVRRFNPQ